MSTPTDTRPDPARRRHAWWITTLLTAALGIAVVLALRSHSKPFRLGFYPLLVWLLAPGVTAWLLARARLSGRPFAWRRLGPLLILAVACLAALFSGWVHHKWFFFLDWPPDDASLWLGAGSVRFVFLTALLTPLFAYGVGRRVWLLPLLVLLGSEWASIHALWRETGGAALYRTDHPSFMLRLLEFTSTFPQLVNYMPQWNGGVQHAVGVPCGVAGPGLILWPLLHYLPIHSVYTIGWILLFLVLVPWIAVLSVRALGGDRTAACIGGLLAMGVSQHYFLWAIHYGTVGASLASAMTIPVSALGYRVVWRRRRGAGTAVALIVSGVFLLLWPPGGLVAVAVALAVLAAPEQWRWRTLGFLAVCTAAILLLYSPWLKVLLVEGRSTIEFVVSSGQAPTADQASPSWLTAKQVSKGFKYFRDHVREMNPLIVIFGIVAVCGGVDRRLRRWYLPILLVLTGVIALLTQRMPHSQLGRIAIPLAFAGVAPAAIFLGRLLRAGDPRLAAVRAGVLALLICTGSTIASICGNQWRANYVAMGPDISVLVAWLRANTPPDGRILFAGSCVHGYGDGTVAYLPILAGREMMAVDYYGFPPEQVVYEYPPRQFNETPERQRAFYDSYNVTHIVTWHEEWKAIMRAEPGDFAEEASIGERITIFSRRGPHRGLFYSGAGSVQATFNRITVQSADPRAECVLAYNWLPGLRVSPPAELFPTNVAEGITFIGLRPQGASALTITYRNRPE